MSLSQLNSKYYDEDQTIPIMVPDWSKVGHAVWANVRSLFFILNYLWAALKRIESTQEKEKVETPRLFGKLEGCNANINIFL